MAVEYQLDAEAFDALTSAQRERFMSLWRSAFPPQSKWYCDRPVCNGRPHPGWHWCKHPVDHPHIGEQYWRCKHARSQQRPPAGDWRVWLILAGRGWGKTRCGAEWIAAEAHKHPGTRWAVVAPTREDLIETMVEGESGLLEALKMDRGDPAYNKSRIRITLPNGSQIRGLSAERPERTRGPNLAGAWLDEVAVWHYTQTYTNLRPALRRGEGRVVVTTTPKPMPLIKEWVRDAKKLRVETTRGRLAENEENLSDEFVAQLMSEWGGTRMARQELEGELLEDAAGALWSREVIDSTRVEIEGLPVMVA